MCLDDAASLRARAITRLTMAAMMASAILAPLVLGVAYLHVGAFADPTVRHLLAAAMAMVPAACLGGFAMHRGAQKRSLFATVAWATFGGVVFLGAAACCLVCAAMSETELARLPQSMLITVAMTCLGSFVSAPSGLLFGLLFLVGLSPVVARLDAPSQDTPARAALASSAMLFVGALVSLPVAASVDVADLPASIPASLRMVCFTLPLALGAFAFFLVGLREWRVLRHARRAMLEGTHPELALGDAAPTDAAIPLTEVDRDGERQQAVVRRGASAYRGGATPMVSVYLARDP